MGLQFSFKSLFIGLYLYYFRNYKAELFAFGARLNETFNEDTLRVAFTNKSYIEQEETKRKEAGVPEDQIGISIQDNDELAAHGDEVLRGYIKPFLRTSFPLWPEEGIEAIEKYLLSTEVLSHVASNIGVKDLILSADHPAENTTLEKTFKAVIGALAKDSNREKAELLIQDFLITQLVSKDVNELWHVLNPMGLVAQILEREGRAPPEPRLVRETGKNTLLAVFQVAIYTDKQFIGIGSGETVDIAEEEAARNCLRRWFETTENFAPMPFGKRGREVGVKPEPNIRTSDWTMEKALSHANITSFENRKKELV